jgi:hypothetical protein
MPLVTCAWCWRMRFRPHVYLCRWQRGTFARDLFLCQRCDKEHTQRPCPCCSKAITECACTDAVLEKWAKKLAL